MSASVPGNPAGAWPSNTIDTRVRPGFRLKCMLFAWDMEDSEVKIKYITREDIVAEMTRKNRAAKS